MFVFIRYTLWLLGSRTKKDLDSVMGELCEGCWGADLKQWRVKRQKNQGKLYRIWKRKASCLEKQNNIWHKTVWLDMKWRSRLGRTPGGWLESDEGLNGHEGISPMCIIRKYCSYCSYTSRQLEWLIKTDAAVPVDLLQPHDLCDVIRWAGWLKQQLSLLS